MSIFQRCEHCRLVLKPTATTCPYCGGALPRSPVDRTLIFKKKIAGRVHSKTVRDVSMPQAERMFREWADSLLAPPPTDAAARTIRDVFDAYLEKLQSEGKNYHKKVRLFFERMVEAWGEIEPEQLNVFMIRTFQSELRRIGAAPAYVDRHLAMGKAAFNHSLPDGPNPFRRVKMYRPDNRLTRWLSEEEEAALIRAAKQCRKGAKHLDAIIIVAINTGMRKENVLSLHTSQTDFETRTITFRQKRDILHSIPMTSLVEQTLRSIHPGNGFYFTSHRNPGSPLTRIEGSFAQAKKLAGIERPFRFHDLRHHCATAILRRTGNLALTGKILGHRELATTMRYAHVIDGDMRAAMETGSPAGSPRQGSGSQQLRIVYEKS